MSTTSVAWLSEVTVIRQLILLGIVLMDCWGCKPRDGRGSLVARETFAELRVVKGQVSITEIGKRARNPYPRERLGEGAEVALDADSLAYLRDDNGATWLVAGPAQARVSRRLVALRSGKAFIDTHGGPAVSLETPGGTLEIAEGRSSIVVTANATVEAYALRGTVRHTRLRANAGEMLTLTPNHAPEARKLTTWTDWTAGLATADAAAQPAPYGIGTVGARAAGDQGKARFPLVIQRLDVRISINQDYAQTEVDETFVNPSSQELEGLFSFRVPANAILHRFGIDRDGLLVWGRTQEKRSAAEQYQSNVYEGSTEDPALLEWVARGAYQARLYPIHAGATRRVVTRYGEWLARHGERGERRLYVYPMAVSGAEGTLPRIEEMTIHVDWSKAQASGLRAPIGSVLRGKQLILKRFDVLPKADFAVELFDAGQREQLMYRAKHGLAKADTPLDANADFAAKTAEQEPDYVLLPLTPPKFETPEPGIDLALVVDSSAATDAASMAVSRSLVEALLTALGPTDRAALFTGDTTLRPVLAETAQLTKLDEPRKKTWLAALANAPLGGATDLGTMLAEAAARLEPKRRGAVIYIGDGRPSVGEIMPKALHERLVRLPATARLFAVGVGAQVNAPLLASLVRGAPLETVQNGYEAAEAALRLLEAATMPAWHNVAISIPGVDRLMPRRIPSVAAGEPALVVGRVAGAHLGDTVEFTHPAAKHSLPLHVVTLDDDGDLRRRWGEERLEELVEQQAGRLAIVDLARRYGLVTPLTSFYVQTKREIEAAGGQYDAANALSPEAEREDRAARFARWRPWSLGSLLARNAPDLAASAASEEEVVRVEQYLSSDGTASNKEGGTGTRAKGEEGSMGNGLARARRYSVESKADAPSQKSVPVPARPKSAKAAAVAADLQGLEMATLGANSRDQSSGPHPPPPGTKQTFDAVTPNEPPSSRDAAALDPSPGRTSALSASGNLSGLEQASPDAPTTKRAMAVHKMSARASASGRLGGSHAAPAAKLTLGEPAVAPGEQRATAQVAKPSRAQPVINAPLAQLSHAILPCSVASDMPLGERRKLWLERLSGNVSVDVVREIYSSAIRSCEAPSWYERQTLLYLMVHRLGSVSERVQLYQSFSNSPDAAAVVFRAILVRIQDAKALREFHEALGAKQASPEMVLGLLRHANGSADRVRLLRGLVAEWPNDFELMIQLLEAYEDARDLSAARSLARRLRRRADATAHVRTLVGEFYWRCSLGAEAKDSVRDLDEARRAFGEIVEFAPDDPAARRRLGDLLRAHGWYEEALRQYETLRELLPDDPTVHLLIAAAARGTGKLEESLRWSEKAAATAAPDSQNDLERAALATSAAFLAWAREDALKTGQTDDAERFLIRGQKLASDHFDAERIRFILTWEHPELHPTLYGLTRSGALPGRQMSPFGVAEQTASIAEPSVELRLDPEDVQRVARLGAEVVLTAILGDGSKSPTMTRKHLRFGDLQHPKAALRVSYKNGDLHEEAL